MVGLFFILFRLKQTIKHLALVGFIGILNGKTKLVFIIWQCRSDAHLDDRVVIYKCKDVHSISNLSDGDICPLD